MENNKKLTRASAGNRMVAGVCAGICLLYTSDAADE